MVILSFFYRAIVAIVALALLLINARLYLPATDEYSRDKIGPDVLAQLRFLREALDRGAGEEMQQFFPEGYFFSHELYGLAWVEVGLREPAGSALQQQALREARLALAAIDSAKGRAPFSPSLEPAYGVFYNGWASWLRGGVLMLQDPAARDAEESARFIADCTALAEAFDASSTPFIQAYPGGAWPVDSVVAVAALSLHDSLYEPRFTATIARWVELAKTKLDPATGLLPHRVDPRSGNLIDGTRGSSQSIIARFLVEIDPTWGQEQYRLFREQFVTTVLGVPGVREYPQGDDSEGDVDSGPLLAGVSLSASAVTAGAALVQGDAELAGPLLHTGEALGMPLEWGGVKRYALGAVPVGDAFLVWAKTARTWVAVPLEFSLPSVVNWWWRVPVHLLCLLLVALLALPIWRRKSRLVAAAGDS